MNGTVQSTAAAAGAGVGGGVAVWAVLRFIRWLVEFIWKRLDIRHARLAQKEKDLEERYDLRLKHLEQELAQTRSAMMMLINEVARKDAANPVLQTVAGILGGAMPFAATDADLTDLAVQAAAAIDGEPQPKK